MNKYANIIQQLKHDSRLSDFLNCTEDELSKKLKTIEEFNGNEGFTVDDYTESPFSGFHPEAIRMVIRDDDYYLHSRANHFILIFGFIDEGVPTDA